MRGTRKSRLIRRGAERVLRAPSASGPFLRLVGGNPLNFLLTCRSQVPGRRDWDLGQYHVRIGFFDKHRRRQKPVGSPGKAGNKTSGRTRDPVTSAFRSITNNRYAGRNAQSKERNKNQ